MTNEELKKKILEIFEKAIGDWYEKDDGLFAEGYTPEEGDNRLKAFMADALIAAGLRFGENLTATFDHIALEREHELERRLAEAERRAEVAERALNKFAENVTCEDCPFFSDCSSLEKMKDSVHSNYCFAEYLRQAEKELAEERKDD